MGDRQLGGRGAKAAQAELEEVLEGLAEADAGVEVDTHVEASSSAGDAARQLESAPIAGTEAASRGAPATQPSPAAPPVLRVGEDYAQRRLALARVVLDAGFAADAVRAAYEGLAAVIGALLSEAPVSHSALVAGIYGQLLPSGRLPGADWLGRIGAATSRSEPTVPAGKAVETLSTERDA